MPADYNRVILGGRVVRTPRVKYTYDHRAFAEVVIACSYKRRDFRGSDALRINELFMDCWVWGRTAELAGEYLDRGSQILVEGRLEMRSWTDKVEQIRRTKYLVKVDKLIFLDKMEKRSSMVPRPGPPPEEPPRIEHMRGPDEGPLRIIWPFDT